MKICENGVYRELTAEEIEEMHVSPPEMPSPEPSPEERIAALEQDNDELRDALDALLLGVTA